MGMVVPSTEFHTITLMSRGVPRCSKQASPCVQQQWCHSRQLYLAWGVDMVQKFVQPAPSDGPKSACIGHELGELSAVHPVHPTQRVLRLLEKL